MSPGSVHLHAVQERIEPEAFAPERFWRLAELHAGESHCVLLDSALDVEPLGRWSFLAGPPLAELTAWSDPDGNGAGPTGTQAARLRIRRFRSADGRATTDEPTEESLGDPLESLRALRDEYWPEPSPAPVPPPDAPPLGAGLVGTLGYELGRCLERLPGTVRDDLGLPLLAFVAVDEVLACDHRTGALTVCVTGRGATDAEAADAAQEALDRWRRRLGSFFAGDRPGPAPAPGRPRGAAPAIRSHFDRSAYCAAVQRCREHIRAGDVFEVCLTHRFETARPASSWELYGALRARNPAPFAAYLRFPGFEAVSASPERFLRLDRARRAESRPIKGTRPRGSDPVEDRRLRDELAASPKDRAENLMIVDLVRSDLGRVAEIGTVEVPELMAVETYATVFQLVSTVRARLRPDRDAVDLLRACFPGGSMTGAPKIEAMKIIDSIEPVARGVYSGAIGYLDAAGAMDLSIVIRTIVCTDARATFGVGGAIVDDSDPAAEYQETLDKAQALIGALRSVARSGRC